MSDYYQACPACNFQIPMNANVCGHCGRDLYRYVESDTSLLGRLSGAIEAGFICLLIDILGFFAFILPISEGFKAIIMLGLFGLTLVGVIFGFITGKTTSYITYL